MSYENRIHQACRSVPIMPRRVNTPLSANVNTVSVPGSVQLLEQQLEMAEQQLSVLREQVMQTQRLATIGTIAAVIAHEFNNLLTPVISYSQVALASAQSDSPDMELIKKALAKSFAGATKAGKVCASMLGLARGESEQTIVNVQSLVDETLLVLARDPQKDGIALRVQVQPGLKVKGDAVQLEQVLLNLLINARQAMLGRVTGSAGSITIKASATDDRHVRISITDTGPGIADNHKVKIFEPFFTTKGTTQNGEQRGTGLGLAICRQIIDHHCGRIEVASEVGRGTTFTLVLPECDEKYSD
jgi:signal transduction histidine kinase